MSYAVWELGLPQQWDFSVAWSNTFRKILMPSCRWENPRILMFYCSRLPVPFLMDQRRMMFWKEMSNRTMFGCSLLADCRSGLQIILLINLSEQYLSLMVWLSGRLVYFSCLCTVTDFVDFIGLLTRFLLLLYELSFYCDLAWLWLMSAYERMMMITRTATVTLRYVTLRYLLIHSF